MYYRDAMRQHQKSILPTTIDTAGPSDNDSYLTPSQGITPITSTPNHGAGGPVDEYLTPLSPRTDEINNNNNHQSSARGKLYSGTYADMSGHCETETRSRVRRLRSVSCEDVSDYLRNVVYDPKVRSMEDLLDAEETGDDEDRYMGPEPFPRLQTYAAADFDGHHGENYYNIEGLKGKIYDGPGLPVKDLIYRFSKKSRTKSRLRRSVSNPNFIGNVSKEKLHCARVSAMYTVKVNKNMNHSSSISNLLPESLKKHLPKDHSKGSHGALSSGTTSPKNSSKASSRASSARSSPTSMRKTRSLPRDEVIAPTSVKGINITRRSRSFKKEKPDKYSRHGENGVHQQPASGAEIDIDGRSDVRQTDQLGIGLQELSEQNLSSKSENVASTLTPKLPSNGPATTAL